MRKSIAICVAALASIGVFGAGYAAHAEETRDLSPFDHLETSRGVEVNVTCGDKTQAVLKGDTEDMEVKVEGRTLIVRHGSMFNGGHHHAQVDVTTARPLDRIEASSGTELKVEGCAVSKERLDVSASSGTAIKLAGATDKLSIDANSGASVGVLRGGRLDAKEARIEVSSGASVRVCAVGRLTGRAGTGGSILTENDASGDTRSSLGGSIASKACN